jgi:hypothetical protein
MSNVLSLQERAQPFPGSSGSRRRRQPEQAGVDSCELASYIAGLQSKAMGEIRNTSLVLHLAAQQAREISRIIRDPASPNDFDRHLSSIEQLLQLVRRSARTL